MSESKETVTVSRKALRQLLIAMWFNVQTIETKKAIAEAEAALAAKGGA
jgi:hypothetical protein